MSRRYPRSPAPLIVDPRTGDVTATHEDPMIIKFTSVTLHKVMPRLDSGMGQATQDTSFFCVESNGKPTGVTIELDTGSQIVCIAKGTAVHNIPRESVERFGPTLEQYAAHAKALAAIATAARLANEEVAAEAAEVAAVPA